MHLPLSDALKHLAQQGEPRFISLFNHGTLQVELYAPRGVDPQQPHLQDEAYVVVSGNGVFRCGEECKPFTQGDFLFVPAGVVHRFEDFSNDLVVWVIFYGPAGGEQEPTNE